MTSLWRCDVPPCEPVHTTQGYAILGIGLDFILQASAVVIIGRGTKFQGVGPRTLTLASGDGAQAIKSAM